MAIKLIRCDNGDKILEVDGDVMATWDKTDSYEYCLEQAQLRGGDVIEVTEENATAPDEPVVEAEETSVEGADA